VAVERTGGAGGGALHRRILADLEGRILTGAWPPGHRIPFEVELAAAYGCSRMTVNKALARLAEAGLIERRRKAGSFVTRPRSQAAILDIHDIRAEVEQLGLPYRFAVTARERRDATAADLARIDVAPGAPLLALEALHFAGERPFCAERRLIALEAAPEAEMQDFAAVAPGPWLVAEIPWTDAEHRISAVEASRERARRLQIRVGAACLVIERRTWRTGLAITSVQLTYPGAAHSVAARFTPAR
jgi:GntR family histidine utilization transcriptional repressor